MMGATDVGTRIEEALFALLDTTESLWAALADGSSIEVWDELLARRHAAFVALEQAFAEFGAERPAVGAAARTCLERIATLDAAILQAGGEGLARFRKERIALGSRRRAVLAHGLQPREIPRAITVKA